MTNETTLGGSRRFDQSGLKPLALNFANGIHPGGGFLAGAKAQEEVLCRSSALHRTLVNDPMYEAHRERPRSDSTDWSIYSPDVPVFRRDDGTELDRPWLLSFITCAAPYAPEIGQPESGDLLQKRIHRVLAIAQAFGYSTLVLGAWGCGAFGNDPRRTAADFRHALENDFEGVFADILSPSPTGRPSGGSSDPSAMCLLSGGQNGSTEVEARASWNDDAETAETWRGPSRSHAVRICRSKLENSEWKCRSCLKLCEPVAAQNQRPGVLGRAGRTSTRWLTGRLLPDQQGQIDNLIFNVKGLIAIDLAIHRPGE